LNYINMLKWLGREDSNLRMAESKSDKLPYKINACSEKTRKFAPRSVNSLAVISEWLAERTIAERHL